MKKLLLLTLSSIMALNIFAASAFAGQRYHNTVSKQHPATKIMELYISNLHADNITIEPYIVSIMALDQVEHKHHLREVKSFIQWYFSRLNFPDKHGLSGTIYVYELKNGQEKSTLKYDSVDGYSGLFLYLLSRYVDQSGDTELIEKNWGKVEAIAYTLPYLQEKDGLTRALPDSQVKYLMDNCESYAGVSAYIKLRALLGKPSSDYYDVVKASIKKGIITNLYDPETGMFHWATEDGEPSRSSWSVFYPDAFAQLFPIYYDILDETPELRQRLWGVFRYKYADIIRSYPVEQRIIYDLTKRKVEGL